MKSNISAPLAEFVGALVVIAMLSVFVIEQLEYRQAERRSASLDGLAGSIRSTAALAHSVWIDSKSADPHVVFGDSHAMEIDLLIGYPSANQHGIEILILDLFVFEGDNKGDSYVFSFRGVKPRSCNVTYTIGSAASDPPRITIVNNNNGGNYG